MHGAGGGHAAGAEHPNWKHGLRSREWEETRKEINEFVRMERDLTALIVDRAGEDHFNLPD